MARAFWLATLIASPAIARQPPVLDVKLPRDASDCPDAATLAASVEKLVGHHALDPQPGGSAADRIEVQIDRTATGYVAHVRTQGRRAGSRELRDDNPRSCSGLADALTLTIALILDAMDSATDKINTEQAPPKQAASQSALDTPKSTWNAALQAGAGVGLGLPYKTGPVGIGAIDLVSSGYSIGAGLIWSGTRSIDYPPGHVKVSLWALALRGCIDILGDSHATHASVCLLGAAGALSGTGIGYTHDSSASRPWYALGTELAGQGPLAGPFDWSVRSMLLAPLNPEAFSVNGIGVAYDSQPVAFILAGAIQTSIW